MENEIQNKKFPPRVRECFSMNGLRLDYFAEGSAGFEATPESEKGREYLSLYEHQEIMKEYEARLERAKGHILATLTKLKELRTMIEGLKNEKL